MNNTTNTDSYKARRKRVKSTVSAYEFMQLFGNEASAREHFESVRWHNGRVCPFCGGVEHSIGKGDKLGHYWCTPCRRYFTARVGTVLESSRLPYSKWLFAIYLVVTERKGISSLQLSKQVGVTQKTAWFMLGRIREACKHADNEALGYIVEIDEMYVGGKNANIHEWKREQIGGGTGGKTPVFGMRERATGKVVAQVIPEVNAQTIGNTVRKHVKNSAVLFTDGARAYKGMSEYKQESVSHVDGEYVRGAVHTNSIESVWSVLKRGIYGVYHQVSAKHLQRYVDEVSFRLGSGDVKVHTTNRVNALLTLTSGKRLTYQRLIGAPDQIL